MILAFVITKNVERNNFVICTSYYDYGVVIDAWYKTWRIYLAFTLVSTT